MLGCVVNQGAWQNRDIRYLPFNIPKHLSITEELAEINVEHMARVFDHDVVVMAISNTENICGHTVASTGGHKVVHSLKQQKTIFSIKVCKKVVCPSNLKLTKKTYKFYLIFPPKIPWFPASPNFAAVAFYLIGLSSKDTLVPSLSTRSLVKRKMGK